MCAQYLFIFSHYNHLNNQHDLNPHPTQALLTNDNISITAKKRATLWSVVGKPRMKPLLLITILFWVFLALKIER